MADEGYIRCNCAGDYCAMPFLHWVQNNGVKVYDGRIYASNSVMMDRSATLGSEIVYEDILDAEVIDG